jgi:hypothetical protein
MLHSLKSSSTCKRAPRRPKALRPQIFRACPHLLLPRHLPRHQMELPMTTACLRSPVTLNMLQIQPRPLQLQQEHLTMQDHILQLRTTVLSRSHYMPVALSTVRETRQKKKTIAGVRVRRMTAMRRIATRNRNNLSMPRRSQLKLLLREFRQQPPVRVIHTPGVSSSKSASLLTTFCRVLSRRRTYNSVQDPLSICIPQYPCTALKHIQLHLQPVCMLQQTHQQIGLRCLPWHTSQLHWQSVTHHTNPQKLRMPIR